MKRAGKKSVVFFVNNFVRHHLGMAEVMGLLMLFCMGNLQTVAQEEVVLSKNFKFQDGLYYSFSDFKNNSPHLTWDTLDANLFVNPQTLIAKVSTLHLKTNAGKEQIVLDSLWGFSLGGIPYIRLPRGLLSSSFEVFAGIKLRGKICYYAYQEEVTKDVPMPIYNPLTRQPFYKTTVKRTFPEVKEWMIDFASGEIEAFTVDNFKNWIKDDPDLLETIEGFDDKKAKDRLFKCLLIYDDRNLVNIKKTMND